MITASGIKSGGSFYLRQQNNVQFRDAEILLRLPGNGIYHD